MFFKQKEITFLVGGSGMYINAVVKGLDNLPKDLNIREELNQRLKKNGIVFLQNEYLLQAMLVKMMLLP